MTDSGGFVKVPSDEEEERMRKATEGSQRKREEQARDLGQVVSRKGYKWTSVVNTVLWSKLRELAAGNKPLLSDFRVINEVTLSPKMGQVLLRD
ncbi:hypothetical protein G7Y89_g13258 [Cudoniella acicularis]|uniref:Uncharacterized protein n=1 Tax=Cudoniella acicularis TaxID=354080 RepID=A0A8H4R8L6_9HELO|nr:hypothetical protein G7Y89_g13258 [Cudoniella acicularis]